jgi:putative membrane protein
MGYGSQWGFMNGWGYGGYGYGVLHMAFWVVILIAIVAGVGWLMRNKGVSAVQGAAGAHRSAGLEVLEERYARGEINRDEYLQKKRDIVG